MKRSSRPVEFTQEFADIICGELAVGHSVRKICEDVKMPTRDTFFKWIREHKDFADQYARAKEESVASIFEEMTEIVDDGRNDWMQDQYMKGKSPGWKVNGEAVQRSKLRWEDRRWKLSKLAPKKYGDKLDITSDGKALPTPIFGGQSKDAVSSHNSDK